MKHDPMLDFVKAKMEEGEGISAERLARLLADADRSPMRGRWRPATALLAASVAIAACGWFFYADAANARRERDLSNVIDLLRLADGDDATDTATLSENLLAWQDAPTQSVSYD